MTLSCCYGCGKPIIDRFLLTVLDHTWHVECVRCHHCQKTLDSKCFFRDNNIYCRDDFYRLYGPRCGGCGEGISPSDLIRKAKDKVFHVKCFLCQVCRKQLSTGEELYILDRDKFLCKDDYYNLKNNQDFLFSDEEDDYDEKLSLPCSLQSPLPPGPLASPLSLPRPAPDSPAPALSLPSVKMESNNNMEAGALGLVTKIKTEEAEYTDYDKDGGDSLNPPDGDKLEQENRSPDGAGGKRRGPRTTIKAKQLEVLKTAFSQTPKPTRHIREQLAKETGLSMRVIQVWFQNKRSKERRMKQLSHGMFPRFFGAPFGDFGYGGRFSGHPADFFPGPGHMGFLGHSGHGGPVPGLPSMEQPLPMSPGLAPDQFPGPGPDIKPPLGLDMAGGFSMAKAVSESPGSFMSGMEMSRISQEMMGSGPHQEYGGMCDSGGEMSDQMIW